MTSEPFFADSLATVGQQEQPVTVTLSNELVALLSEQLYQSPLKALEELVVNSYDADARECKLFVPSALDLQASSGQRFLLAFDDGHGMAYPGLVDLWQVGRSEKRNPGRSFARAQIGKFGIGKLATYTIANRVSYVTKTQTGVLTVSIDFRQFQPSSGSRVEPVVLPVRRLPNPAALGTGTPLHQAFEAAGVTAIDLGKPSWTGVLLEDLKPKAETIRSGRLEWVLRTAMPLRPDFTLWLNGAKVESSKEGFEKLVEFEIRDIDKRRLEGLAKVTGETFKPSKGGLVSATFPNGIFGSVFVTRKSLLGKSDDLTRSNGFFVKVRGRLINEDEPLFGLPPLSHQTFNRFRADIAADDLDHALTAPREGIEASDAKARIEAVMRTIFAEARDRYERVLNEEGRKKTFKREGEREFVPVELVEFPVADVLATLPESGSGAEADSGWFYLSVPPGADAKEIARGLYSGPRRKYRFTYESNGRNQRLVKFDPVSGTFFLNQDHQFVLAHADNPRTQLLLEDFVLAEVLLEVYLKEHGIPGAVIGDVLEQRDKLLRSLPGDHPYSLRLIASALRDAAANERDLEINLVAAARALGFVAAHVTGPDAPDGIARYSDYPDGEKLITLEAKSSADVPSLSAIDFAGIKQHVTDKGADGCLLVAPAYPGEGRGDYSAAARRAREQEVSCWTIEQLASVVEAVESNKVSARLVLEVVLNSFSPEEVTAALSNVFGEPRWPLPALYAAILKGLRTLEGQLPRTVRNVSHISAILAAEPKFAGVDEEDIKTAVAEMAAASKGSMELRDRNIILLSSLDEIERRLAGLLTNAGQPRRPSQLRE